MSVFTTDIMLRWGDMDSLGHVNNATILTLLEEGRVRVLAELGRSVDGEFGLVVARHEIDYRRPLRYAPEPVAVSTWLERVGSSSFTFGCEIHQQGTCAVRARTVVVAVTPDGSRSTPLPDSARVALQRYLVEPAAAGDVGE